MFEKVCGTVVGCGFVAGSSVDPYPDRGGLGPEDGFGCDAEVGWEGGDVGGGRAEDVVGECGGGGCGGGGSEGSDVDARGALDSLVVDGWSEVEWRVELVEN